MEKNKVLIIRFSSFGDIIQCSSVVEAIAQEWPAAELHWATKNEFAHLLELNEGIHFVHRLNKKEGIFGLIKYALKLRAQQFDFVYDAHNNMRSLAIRLVLCMRMNRPKWVTRSKDRWKRILLFKFRINHFPKPFKGIESFCFPLKKFGLKMSSPIPSVRWKFDNQSITKAEAMLESKDNFVTLVPSAAWEMKRWPLEFWKEVIRSNTQINFVILGGKEDTFCEELKQISPARVNNLAGKLSLVESSYVIKKSKLVISADTGLLHVADVLGVKGISLMGPTAFGFTTSQKIVTLEVPLNCRPCSKDGRGGCSQKVYQQCMVEITPQVVSSTMAKLLYE